MASVAAQARSGAVSRRAYVATLAKPWPRRQKAFPITAFPVLYFGVVRLRLHL